LRRAALAGFRSYVTERASAGRLCCSGLLHRYEAHGRACHRVADRLGGRVFFLRLTYGFASWAGIYFTSWPSAISSRAQQCELLQASMPTGSAAAARRRAASSPRQPTANQRLAIRSDPMHLEHRLRGIQADRNHLAHLDSPSRSTLRYDRRRRGEPSTA
jgi:hypothetical protein